MSGNGMEVVFSMDIVQSAPLSGHYVGDGAGKASFGSLNAIAGARATPVDKRYGFYN